MAKKKNYESITVRGEKVLLIRVPHRNSITIPFVYKKYGSANQIEVANSIEKDGLVLSNQGQNVSLVCAIFGDIKAVERNNILWSYTDVHYFPKDIRFYHDFSSLSNRLKNPTRKQLESMLGF